MKRHKGTNKKPGFLNTANWLDCPCFLVLIGKGCSGSRELQKNDSIKKINLGWSVSRSSGPTLLSVRLPQTLDQCQLLNPSKSVDSTTSLSSLQQCELPPYPTVFVSVFLQGTYLFPLAVRLQENSDPFPLTLVQTGLKSHQNTNDDYL